MTLDLPVGATVTIAECPYTVEEHASFHDIDFRMDLIRLAGATPAHERWVLTVLPEPFPMLLCRLAQDWLAAPQRSIQHEGEIYVNLYRGSANRVRRQRGGRSKEGRVDYGVFRANSGRILFLTGQNDEYEAWIGMTVPADAIVIHERP